MNASVTVKGNKMIIEVDISKDQGPSSSGKNINVVSSGGFTPIAGTDMKLNINVIKPIKAPVTN